MRFAREAYCPEDLQILGKYTEILGLGEILVSASFFRPMLRAMRFLRLCDYHVEDLCCMMAYALSYFRTVYDFCGAEMDASEAGNVTVTLLFLAHSYTMDEVC